MMGVVLFFCPREVLSYLLFSVRVLNIYLPVPCVSLPISVAFTSPPPHMEMEVIRERTEWRGKHLKNTSVFYPSRVSFTLSAVSAKYVLKKKRGDGCLRA